MFSITDMIYFTDPVPTPLGAKDKLLVTDTAYDRNSRYVGTIVNVKPGVLRLNGRVWKVTEDGTYVTGHAILPKAMYGKIVVGLMEGRDDVFFVGNYQDSTFNGQGALIASVLNSNAEYLVPSMEGHRHNTLRLNVWLEAAPWAFELMPRVTDSAATVAAKLELAKARWEINRAVIEMAAEGYQRSWTEELKTLHSNEDLDFLPRPLLGVLYDGEVLLGSAEVAPRRDSLTPSQQRQLEALQQHQQGTANPVTPKPPRIPVNVSLPLDLKLNPEEVLLPDATLTVERAAARLIDNPDVSLGAHRLTYFVNGLTALL